MPIAVLTDATSPGFTFPLWRDYYGAKFGAENLFVVTYAGADGMFDHYGLGGVRRLDVPYSDDLRLVAISEFLAQLLKTYDAVVRVDVDEFIVVDPRARQTLCGFVEASSARHVTARGFDIIPAASDLPIDFGRPVLRQRRLAFALTAMNKTCITREPLKWGRGFHYCSAPPALDGVFLFHLKRVDFALQRAWATRMANGFVPDSFEAKYYQDDLKVGENFVKSRWSRHSVDTEEALDRTAFNQHFLSTIRLDDSSGLYEGDYDIEDRNVVIPARFADVF